MNIIHRLAEYSECESWSFWCPACECGHRFVTKWFNGRQEPVWSWNGDMEKPTIRPSIRCTGQNMCHIVVTDGKIAFCDDSWKFAGQTMDMEPL